MDTRRYIIDTDAGIDDLQALFLAFKHLNVVAITTVTGNVSLEKVTKNVAKVLEVSQKRIPIYCGAEMPLCKDSGHAENYHGKDGMGDNEEIGKMEGSTELINTTVNAAEFILQESKTEGLNMICIGPLTNLAIAMTLDSSLQERIENTYIMGGTLFGKGNIAPNKEFNFNFDPEATAKVINNSKNMHIIPWEATVDNPPSKSFEEAVFDKDADGKLKFFAQANQKNFDEMKFLEICDGFAVLAIINPELWTESYDLIAEVYTQGEAAGQISYMWEGYWFAFDKEKVNWKVYHKFNMEECWDLLLQSLTD